MSRRRRNTRTRKKKASRSGVLALLAACKPFSGEAFAAIAIGVTIAAAVVALDCPVSAVDVKGEFHRVNPREVEALVLEQVNGGVLSANLADIRRHIEAAPWVDRVRLVRRWPDTIEVFVVEQVAAARWGERGLLNERGELFAEAQGQVPAELARLSGPARSERDVADLYFDAREHLLPLGLGVASVDLSERGAWRLVLTNGTDIRLGRGDAAQGIARFVSDALPLLTERFKDVSYVDLRYDHGFAVGWRGPRTAALKGVGNDG